MIDKDFKDAYEKYLENQDRYNEEYQKQKIEEIYRQIKSQQFSQPYLSREQYLEKHISIKEKELEELKKELHGIKFKDKFEDLIK